MAHSIKSMRGFLLASLQEFASTSNLDTLATTDNLTLLVASLAHYQEEGTRLVPELFLCKQIEKLIRTIPNSQIIKLGSHSQANTAIELALKKGAPLAVDGWCIYIDESEYGFRFGVFRGPINPLALNIEKSVFGTPDRECPAVRINQTAPGCIEIRNSFGVTHSLLLNNRSDQEGAPSAHLDELVAQACRLAPDTVRDPLKSYFSNVIGRGLHESHGAIIVVTQSEKIPLFLNDGINLSPPIRFSELVLATRETNRERIAEQELLANSRIIKGMIRSDGITVLSPKGTLLGYNCFIKTSSRVRNLSGGARNRAYETLVTKIGKGISAVFARSQDGMTKFAKRKL